MPSTAHPDAFHFDRPVASYWEASADPLGIDTPPLDTDASCDVAVIGAGFTGLSAALRLREEYGMDVRVLEAAAAPGWGASGRNGGFCSPGGTKLSWSTMIARYGLEEAKRFFDVQLESVQTVREVCRRFGIDAWLHEGGELQVAHKPSRVEALREEKAFLETTFGKAMTFLTVDELKERGCYAPTFHAGLHSQYGCSVQPLNYARGLARAAAGNSVRIHGASRVARWEERPDGHRLTTDRGATLTAKQVVVATNGFTQEEVSRRHAGRLMPVLSSIIVTRPLSDDERRAQGWTSRLMAYDSRQLLHYFRLLPDGRFLFGGRGGVDSSDWGDEHLLKRLRGNFERMFPAWAQVEHTHYWKGLVCLSYDLVPYIGPLDERRSVWTAIAYHGTGVAMASYSGQAVADLVAGHPEKPRLPTVLTRRLAAFPLPALRPVYLKGAYVWYDVEDAML
jgi:glycine/D-amino acid oxidase-like deaminating enzyme